TANVIFSVIDQDGARPIMHTVWDRVMEVREAVFRTIEEHSPPDWSFVLTNVLLADLPGDIALAERIMRMAESRGSAYVPVAVRCETEELLARVPRDDRRANMKWIDPDGVRTLLDTRPMFVPEGSLLLDTTLRPPAE